MSPSSNLKSNSSLISILSNCPIQILTLKRLNSQVKIVLNLSIIIMKSNNSSTNTNYSTKIKYKFRDSNKETALTSSFPYKKMSGSKSNFLIGLTETLTQTI